MARNIQSPTQPDLPAGSFRSTRPLAIAEAPVGLDPESLVALEPRMRAVALRMTRDPDTAGDVVQSASEKIWRNRSQFRGDAKLSTWVHRIVVNEALMLLRARKRRDLRVPLTQPAANGAAAEEILDETPSAPSRMERHEEIHRVRSGLARLRPDERDVLIHCALEGWSYERYGRHRGLGTAAVKSRAFRARRQLARMLAS